MNQKTALSILKSGRNVFLTGSAGTGKTYVLNAYVKYLKARRIPVSVTASTGIAATHLEGTTIHAWSGIGIRDELSTRQLRDLKSKKYLQKNMTKTKVLIIDEISMLHQKQFDLVNKVLKSFRESEEAFGGVQLVLCGDFFQLPPIGDSGESSRDKFCFMSASWMEAGLTICYLDQQFRQTDTSFNDLLNEIRSGQVSSNSIKLLKSKGKGSVKDQATKLYTHNADVDKINAKHLSELDGPKRVFKAKVKGNLKLGETIKKSIMAPVSLELKEGARVMFVKNNYDKGYLNGSLGQVDKFDSEGIPVVRLSNGTKIKAEREEWRIEDESGKLLVSYAQVPLRLAWAITVHKSQGMTLDQAQMDLSKTFEKGQGYVALSRVKDLDGLDLQGFNELALQVDGLALRADQRFQVLSKEAESACSAVDMEALAELFIKKSGGVLDKSEIEENKRNLDKAGKVGKKSTYAFTRQLIEEGYNLEEIAAARDLSPGTVITHLIKISTMYPKTDLKRFKPNRSTMAKVRNARKRVLKKGADKDRVSLKPIFSELSGELSYEEIKLALVFL